MTPYQLTTLQEVNSKVKTEEPLMFDTESNDLYADIELAQFYQEGWPEVLMVRHPDIDELIALLDKSYLIIQNSAYDISTVQAQSKTRWIPGNFDDIFYLARLKYYTETSFTLDNIMFLALKFDPYKDQGIEKKKYQKSNWSGDLTEEQYIYAATDVYYMPDVFKQVKEYITDDNYRLDIVATKHALDFQNNGFPVDERKRKIAELEYSMLAEEEEELGINVNSWRQVRKYIDEDQSDDLALATFAKAGNTRAEAVRRVKSAKKKHSTLVKKFKSPDNRIYGKFSPITRSGRFSCKDQNLQQLDRKLKGVFGFPEDDGLVLIYSDYSQCQLRCACAILNEKVMEALYRSGEDIHTYVQNRLGDLSSDPDGRRIAKTCNFSLLFGGSAGMLGSILLKDADIILPEDELWSLKNGWVNLWPAIKAWHNQGSKDHKNGTHDDTPMGRRYYGKRFTDQLNIKIQGAEADIAKYAMHLMLEKLKPYKDVMLCNFIHDSFILEAPNDPDIYVPVAQIVGEAMRDSWKVMSRYFIIKDLPLPVEVKVGYNWGDIEYETKPCIYELKL